MEVLWWNCVRGVMLVNKGFVLVVLGRARGMEIHISYCCMLRVKHGGGS